MGAWTLLGEGEDDFAIPLVFKELSLSSWYKTSPLLMQGQVRESHVFMFKQLVWMLAVLFSKACLTALSFRKKLYDSHPD